MSNNEKYTIPEGAKPWVPNTVETTAEEAESREDPAPKSVDTSRQVPGVVSGLDAPQPEPAKDGPQPSEVIDISGDDDSKDETAEDEDDVGTHMCPACGTTITADDGLSITDEDKDRWLRHILGEDRFRQTYTVFDGRMQVTFRSRTTEENDMLFKQLTHELNENLLPEAPYFASPAYVARMNRLMLTLSLEKITRFVSNEQGDSEGRPTTYPPVTAENYNSDAGDNDAHHTPLGLAHEDLLRGMDEGLVAVLMMLLRRFDALTSTLVMKSSDPDFWTPAGDGR